MNIDFASFIASTVVGTIGFVLLVYGKRQGRVPHMVTGGILMAFPYFVDGAWLVAAIGAAVLAAFWYAVRRLDW